MFFVWQRHIVDSAGNALNDATVEVRDAGTLALSSIFSDVDGTTPKSNPFLVDSVGFAVFYAAAGLYKITATRAGLERIWEDVLLGIRVADFPDLTTLVEPIVAAILDPAVEEIEAQVQALPVLQRFSVSAVGAGTGLPQGWTSERLSQGRYRVAHGLSTLNYHPKLTVWDPSNDRVYSAMLIDKQINHFDYRVRSIHDVASTSDAQVDVEVTVA